MFGVSRRLVATVGAAATILVLSTSTVAAADPDASTAARANGSSTGASVTLGAKFNVARPGRLQLDHGGGLQPPATDVESPSLDVGVPVSGVGVALATWILVFVAGVLASLRYMARRSRP
jgi:hypothetical protein